MKPKDVNALNKLARLERNEVKVKKYCSNCGEIYPKVAVSREYCKRCNCLLSNYTDNIPKCPTCQSIKVEKISTTSRVVHGAAFGILSKTARSQFKCRNCGYKW